MCLLIKSLSKNNEIYIKYIIYLPINILVYKILHLYISISNSLYFKIFSIHIKSLNMGFLQFKEKIFFLRFFIFRLSLETL